METENVPARAQAAGTRLANELGRVPGVAAVRGAGLLLAVELDDDVPAAGVTSSALDLGLVVNAVTPTAVRLAPSLLVTDDEIDEAVAILSQAIGAVTAAAAVADGG
jgi:acetylornithine/succinyldiaminopimelate/putrescine aminotransferase